ncbi:MAG TPA: hypothetical protein VG714_02860 [Acidobacteriaceae bacterium]|nr:hypothetical protein [Acidobacteriaceae bacterium]
MSALRQIFPPPSSPGRSSRHLVSPILAVSLGFATVLALTPCAHAAAFDESVPTPEALAQLELRASQASPREQPWLYTEIIHTMTEKAGKELSAGDDTAARNTLQQVSHYAHLVQSSLARNTKQLKKAEMLMQHTTWRLAQYMHLASPDDKPEVQATLKQLDQINDQLLTQVFQH